VFTPPFQCNISLGAFVCFIASNAEALDFIMTSGLLPQTFEFCLFKLLSNLNLLEHCSFNETLLLLSTMASCSMLARLRKKMGWGYYNTELPTLPAVNLFIYLQRIGQLSSMFFFYKGSILLNNCTLSCIFCQAITGDSILLKFEKARCALQESLRRVEDIVAQAIGCQVL